MLNNERKFPKREPVWKPLFDIFLLSLFFRPKKITPGEAAHAELAPGARPSRPGKISLKICSQNNTGGTASYQCVKSTSRDSSLILLLRPPRKSRQAKFIAVKDE